MPIIPWMFPGTFAVAVLFASPASDPPLPPKASLQAPTPCDRVGDFASAADAIDRLIEQRLRAAGIAPAPIVDDATFARRAWVSIAGRIPTVAELEQFLSSQDADRREELVARLLGSSAHQSRMFHFWADLLRLKNRIDGRTSGEPYIHFVKQALADNLPYDEFVRQLVTAEGPALERGNGATGYVLRDRGMPEDHAANTMRVFLGTRMECAQCHNHPFDRWTQQDFVRLVAFEGGVRYTHIADTDLREVMALGRRLRQEDPQAYRAYRRLALGANAGVTGAGTGLARLPKDYAYDDADALDVVSARVPFGALPSAVAAAEDRAMLAVAEPRQERNPRRFGAPRGNRGPRDRFAEVDSRAAFAEWLTSPENERFTTVIANRMWQLVMGRGLIEPVDDLRDDTEAVHPDVMLALRELLVQLDFDLQRFQQVLYSTRTFQREAQAVAEDGDAPYLFAGPVLRRMTAEQVWDSLLTLVLEDADATLGSPADGAEAVYAQYEQIRGMDADALLAEAQRRSLRFRDPEAFREMQAEQRARGRSERGQLRRQLNAARRDGDRALVADLERQLAELRAEARTAGGMMGRPGQAQRGPGRRGARGAVRASELPTPAPAGHFLRRFGQSDREQIQTSVEEANVPQVLGLLNGIVEQQVLARDSHLVGQLRSLGQPEAVIDHAFRAVLGRSPTPAEANLWAGDLRRNPTEGARDLVWVLLNTHEFLFVR